MQFNSIRCYLSWSEWTWEWWRWMDTLHYPKLQHNGNLTTRLFSVISRIFVGRVLPLCREGVGVFYSRIQPANSKRSILKKINVIFLMGEYSYNLLYFAAIAYIFLKNHLIFTEYLLQTAERCFQIVYLTVLVSNEKLIECLWIGDCNYKGKETREVFRLRL